MGCMSSSLSDACFCGFNKQKGQLRLRLDYRDVSQVCFTYFVVEAEESNVKEVSQNVREEKRAWVREEKWAWVRAKLQISSGYTDS